MGRQFGKIITSYDWITCGIVPLNAIIRTIPPFFLFYLPILTPFNPIFKHHNQPNCPHPVAFCNPHVTDSTNKQAPPWLSVRLIKSVCVVTAAAFPLQTASPDQCRHRLINQTAVDSPTVSIHDTSVTLWAVV